ncbi:hypothetical protein E8E14_010685 [Neopestalotiopsis sp. 37M]|nr:hypothetical protein E8E14_010685 [Neopestalotiopsis sp. 37M]
MEEEARRAYHQPIDLLLQVLPILTRAVILAATREVDGDARSSYRRLQGWFKLLHDELDRTKDVIVLSEEHFNLLFDRLGGLVVAPLIKPSAGLERLRGLWHEKRHSSATETLQWLDLSSHDFNEHVEAIIREVYDFSQMQYPYDFSLYTDDPPIDKRKRAAPPLDVCEAAQSVYQALKSTQKCTCDPVHSFDARLSLATYRNPNSVMGSFRFEMLLSLEHVWQEVTIGTTAGGALKFVINDGSGKNTNAESKKAIRHLCKPLRQIRKQLQWRSYCLQFDVDKGVLWNRRPEKSLLPLDLVEKPVSLEEFILTSGHCLTEMTKRIIAVLLGHTVLHLHGTQWMHQDWGASQVIFLQAASAVPIKPYIQIRLTPGAPISIHTTDSDDDSDDEDYFGDDFCHPFPHFVSLGMMLMQIYLGKTFQSLAEEFDIDNPELLDKNHKFVLASQVFLKYSAVIKFSERFWSVIDRCLDPDIQNDERGCPMTVDVLRKVVYDDIIRPLEDELEKGNFSTDNIVLNLDSEARKLDLANMGQSMEFQVQRPGGQPKGSDGRQQFSPRSLESRLFSPSPAPLLVATGNNQAIIGRYRKAGFRKTIVRYSKSKPIWQSAKQDMAFFDDESQVEDISQKAKDAFLSWKEDILDVYDRFLVGDTFRKHTAIAILDTGFDMDHPDLAFNMERKIRINGSRNFCSSATQYGEQDVRDNNGHGTHAAGLILDFAPNAQVYIAKIADHEPSPCHLVAEAIRHAVTSWRVDIISMSFGFNSRESKDYHLIEQAVEYANSHNVLIFAAASNSGANQQPEDGVPSRFNPPWEETDNFATIGEAVESSWPVRLCDKDSNESCVAWKSGTSFATPIAAGIAAFLLQYTDENLDPKCVALLRRPRGMRAVLKEISRKSQGFDYVAPKLHPDHLFGKDPEYVKQRLAVVLQGS